MNLKKFTRATMTAGKSKTKVMASEPCAYPVIRPDTDFSEAQQKKTVFFWLLKHFFSWVALNLTKFIFPHVTSIKIVRTFLRTFCRFYLFLEYCKKLTAVLNVHQISWFITCSLVHLQCPQHKYLSQELRAEWEGTGGLLPCPTKWKIKRG